MPDETERELYSLVSTAVITKDMRMLDDLTQDLVNNQGITLVDAAKRVKAVVDIVEHNIDKQGTLIKKILDGGLEPKK